jgi:uncharacterized protein YjiS (DUF1127 family)
MSLINLLVSARQALVQHRQRCRAFDELMSLDDRALADIGIHRSEIAALIAGVEPANGHDAEPEATIGAAFNCSPRLAAGRPFLPPL